MYRVPRASCPKALLSLAAPLHTHTHTRPTGQYAAFTAFIEPGDEVIIFEPFFDQYLPSVAFNGGKCVYVPLHPSAEPAPGVQIGKRSWTIDFDELE